MAPQLTRSLEILKLGVGGGAAGLFATDQGAFLRLQNFDKTLDDIKALVEREKMEKEAGVDDVDLAVEIFQWRVRVERVGGEKGGLERILVEKEFVAEVEEAGFEITAIEVLRRRAVTNKFAEVLGKAAANVQE